jgi:hypothetical protein
MRDNNLNQGSSPSLVPIEIEVCTEAQELDNLGTYVSSPPKERKTPNHSGRMLVAFSRRPDALAEKIPHRNLCT